MEQINLTCSLVKCLEEMPAETNKDATAQAVLKGKALQAEHAIAFGAATLSRETGINGMANAQ